jgi:hypothetical protein
LTDDVSSWTSVSFNLNAKWNSYLDASTSWCFSRTRNDSREFGGGFEGGEGNESHTNRYREPIEENIEKQVDSWEDFSNRPKRDYYTSTLREKVIPLWGIETHKIHINFGGRAEKK